MYILQGGTKLLWFRELVGNDTVGSNVGSVVNQQLKHNKVHQSQQVKQNQSSQK